MLKNIDKEEIDFCLLYSHSLSFQRNHLNKYLHNLDKVRSYLSKIPENLYISKQLPEHTFDYNIATPSTAEGLYSLFYLGNFEKVYHLTSKYKNGDLIYLGDNDDFDILHNILSNDYKLDDIIFSKLPLYALMDMTVEQSSEDSNENYPEVKAAQDLIMDMIKNNVEINEEYMTSLSKKEDEAVRFATAEKAFYLKNYRTAYNLYLSTASVEPSKAIYYGFASNMLYKLIVADEPYSKSDVIEMIVTARRAVDLDFNNARWHLYLAYALFCAPLKLGNFTLEMAISFCEASIEEFFFAKSLIRDDQANLLKSIETSVSHVQKTLEQMLQER